MRVYKAKKGVLINAVAYISIFVLGVMMAFLIMQDIYEMAVSNITDQLLLSSEEVGNYVQARLGVIQNLSTRLSEKLTDEFVSTYHESAALLQFLEETSVFDNLALVDAKGNMHSAENGQTDYVGDTEPFQRAMQGEYFVSRPFDSVRTGEPLILFCAPIYSAEKEIIGVVSGAQYLDNASKALAKDFYHGDGYCHIVDNEGYVIMRSTNLKSPKAFDNLFEVLQQEIKNKASGEKIVSRLQEVFHNKEHAMMEADIFGVRELFGSVSVSAYPQWNIVCVIRVSDVWQASAPLITKTLFLTIASIVMLYILGHCRRTSAREMERVAFEDDVTGGHNFNYFKRCVPAILRANKQNDYCIIRFGITHFKYFNSNFGYQTGNRLLNQIYQMLKALFPEEAGQLVARLHSDEFVVLSKTKPNNPEEIVTVVHSLEQAARLAGAEYQLSVTYGVYLLEMENPEAVVDMVEKAGLAQSYFSENPFEHGFIYDERLTKVISTDSQLESHMEAALKKEEFLVYIQPKVAVDTQLPVGGEALVRWNSETFGFLAPGQFIPLFEKNGFVQELDFYMLERVLQFLKDRFDKGLPPITIAVNQSRQHSFNPNYLNRLQSLVDKYGVPPKYVELEITESMILENMEKMIETIKAMRKMGFQISIDDFGSGYTSLSFLRRVDVDVIKIDRSLIDGAEQSRKKYTMLEYLIAMIHALGVEVVCEGVETQEQLALVRKVHGDIVQGYYYAKPMSKEDFELYIADKFV